MKRTNKSVLGKKVLFYNSLVIGIGCFIIYILVSVLYTIGQKKSFDRSVEVILESKGNIVNGILDDAHSSAVKVTLNSTVGKIFSNLRANSSAENYFKKNQIEKNNVYDALMGELIINDMISRICIFNENGDFIAVGDGTDDKSVSKYMSAERLDNLKQMFQTQSVVCQVSEKDLLKEGSERGYISVIQEINYYTYDKRQSYGYVEVQVDLPHILRKLDSADIEQKVELKYNGKTFLETSDMVYDGWTIKEKQLQNGFLIKVFQSNQSVKKIILLTVGIWTLLALSMVFLIYIVQKKIVGRITTPLIELCTNLRKFDFEQKSYFFVTSEGEVDEVKELKKSFGNMMQNLQNSANELILEKTEKANAQMLALQAQINPHFIHNTLMIISSQIDFDRNMAKETINYLSYMIRYSADYSTRYVNLAEELKQAAYYLELIKIRYTDDFQYYISEVKKEQEIWIPKFILQPLIENSIQHSLKKKEFPWKIAVMNSVSENDWRITVYDNGVGISDEEIKKLYEQWESIIKSDVEGLIKKLKIGGYSLVNTLTRLYITYGEDMNFSVIRNSDGGTTVTIGSTIKGEK